MDNFDDDIIWDSSDNNKRRNKPSPQPKNSQPEPEIPAEQPIKRTRPAQPRTPQEQVQAFLRAEQIRSAHSRTSYNRPLGFLERFGESLTDYYQFRLRLQIVRLIFGCVIVFIYFVFAGMGIPIRIRPNTVRPQRERVQQETRTQEDVQSQQQASSQNSLISRENRVLYLENFSAVTQVILTLKAEGRYCSFTSLGLANCFANKLDASRQSGNVLYLADGTTYTFDCENQKCTLNVGLNGNNAEVMPIPLSADADGNIVIHKNDVARFLNE